MEQSNSHQLQGLPAEYFEMDPLVTTPHSNQSSENKNISSQLDTFTSDENDDKIEDNQDDKSDQILKKMGEMLASTIFVYAYLNVSQWTLNWVARNVFQVQGDMFSWNIYKLIKK